MGGFTGKYSRSPFATFNEEKNYAFALMQEGAPVTDDDENASRLGLFTKVRRGNQLFGNYGTPNDGFRVEESTISNVNNFKLTGGGPANTDIELAGRFFMRGIGCVLMHDVDYLNARSDISEQSIHPRITNVYYDGTDTVVEDSAANWGTNEIQGRSVRINSTDRAIVSNGQDFFKVSGDHTVGSADPDPIADLDYYILLLSTPGASRTDAVYLNVYVDEYDGEDDSEITKQIGGVEVVAQLRAKVIQNLYVRQDVPTWGELVDYLDSNGNQHYVFKLASLSRDTNNTITAAEINDLVPTIGLDVVGQDRLSSLRATAHSPADDSVNVESGTAMNMARTDIVAWGGGSSPSFPFVGVGYKRWDLLYLKDDGTLARRGGTETTGTPVRPHLAEVHGTPIAYVYIDESSTPAIASADILDARPFLSPDHQVSHKFPPPGDLSAIFNSQQIDDGDTIVLSPGIYTLSNDLIITKKIKIVGDDDHVYNDLHQPVIQTGGYQITINAHDVTLENLQVIVTATAAASQTAAIKIGPAYRAVIRSVQVGCSIGTAARDYSIEISAGAADCTIESCYINNLGDDYLIRVNAGVTGTSVTIKDTKFRDDRAPDTKAYTTLFGWNGSAVNVYVIDCEFNISGISGSFRKNAIELGNNWTVDRCRITGYLSASFLTYGIATGLTDFGGGLRYVRNTKIRDCEILDVFRGIMIECEIEDMFISRTKIAADISAYVCRAIDIRLGVPETWGAACRDLTIENCTLSANHAGIRFYATTGGDEFLELKNFHVVNNRIDVLNDLGSENDPACVHLDIRTSSFLWLGDVQINNNSCRLTTVSPATAPPDYGGVIRVQHSVGFPTANGRTPVSICGNTITWVGDLGWNSGAIMTALQSSAWIWATSISGNAVYVEYTGTYSASWVFRGVYAVNSHPTTVSGNTVTVRTIEGVMYGIRSGIGSITGNSILLAHSYSVSTPAGAAVAIDIGWRECVVSGNQGYYEHAGFPTGGSIWGINTRTYTRVSCTGNIFANGDGNWVVGIYSTASTYSVFDGNIVAANIVLGAGSIKHSIENQ